MTKPYANVNILNIARKVKLEVRLQGMFEFTLRWKLGTWLILLGCWVLPVDCTMREIKTGE